jgi:hypothetical protein
MNEARRTFLGLVRKSLGVADEGTGCCAEPQSERASPGAAEPEGAACCGKSSAAEAVAPPARASDA